MRPSRFGRLSLAAHHRGHVSGVSSRFGVRAFHRRSLEDRERFWAGEDRHLATRGDQTALVWISTEVDREERYTYRDLHREVQRAAG